MMWNRVVQMKDPASLMVSGYLWEAITAAAQKDKKNEQRNLSNKAERGGRWLRTRWTDTSLQLNLDRTVIYKAKCDNYVKKIKCCLQICSVCWIFEWGCVGECLRNRKKQRWTPVISLGVGFFLVIKEDKWDSHKEAFLYNHDFFSPHVQLTSIVSAAAELQQTYSENITMCCLPEETICLKMIQLK